MSCQYPCDAKVKFKLLGKIERQKSKILTTVLSDLSFSESDCISYMDLNESLRVWASCSNEAKTVSRHMITLSRDLEESIRIDEIVREVEQMKRYFHCTVIKYFLEQCPRELLL